MNLEENIVLEKNKTEMQSELIDTSNDKNVLELKKPDIEVSSVPAVDEKRIICQIKLKTSEANSEKIDINKPKGLNPEILSLGSSSTSGNSDMKGTTELSNEAIYSKPLHDTHINNSNSLKIKTILTDMKAPIAKSDCNKEIDMKVHPSEPKEITKSFPSKDSIMNINIGANMKMEETSTLRELNSSKLPGTNFFPKLKQEGRAKMSAPSKGDPKQNEALLKLVMSKETNASGAMLKPVSTDHIARSKSLAMSMTKMANLKNILNSVMKTSISQVLRTKIDPKLESKNENEEVKNVADKDETIKKYDTEKKDSSIIITKVPETNQENTTLNDNLKDTTALVTAKKNNFSDMAMPSCSGVGLNKARKSMPSWTVKIQPKTGTSMSSPAALQTVVLTRNQAAKKAIGTKTKKQKRKHFKGGTYSLYLSKLSSRKKRRVKKSDFTGGVRDEEASITGTETTGSFIDSEEEGDEGSFISEGYTPSELSFQDEEVSSEQSNISPTPLCKVNLDSSNEEKVISNNAKPEIQNLATDEKKQEEMKEMGIYVEKNDLKQKENDQKIENSEKVTLHDSLEESFTEKPIPVEEEPTNATVESQLMDDINKVNNNDTSTLHESEQEVKSPKIRNDGMFAIEQADVPEPSIAPEAVKEEIIENAAIERDVKIEKSISEDNTVIEDASGLKEKMELEETANSEGGSSIATIVKTRIRLKRRNTDDLSDLQWRNDDAVSITSSISACSETVVHSAKKMKKVLSEHLQTSTTENLPIPENEFIPKIDIVYYNKLPPMTYCTCVSRPLEASSTNRSSEVKIYCQALDSIDDKLVGCCNYVTNQKLVRPSLRIPFTAMCEVHLWRLRHHHCCPGCGIFCTQGSFLQCISTNEEKKAFHFFHKHCQTIQDNGLPSLCPHCGSSSIFRSVTMEMNLPTPPTFYLTQKPALTDTPKAKMTFSRLAEADEAETDDLPSRTFTLPESGKILSSTGLPLGPDRVQLEALLVSLITEKSLSPRYNVKDLYEPSKAGDVDKVLNLLVTGSDPNIKFEDHDNETALHAAAMENHLVVVHLLVQAGALMDQMDDNLCTPLMLAIEKKHVPIVQYLIKAGAQLDARGEEGMTALHLSSRCGDLRMCKLLLDTGRINVNVQDEGGWTPIVWASEHKHMDVIRLLLERGADPNIRDNEGNIALHWSAFSGSVDISQMYLDIGCDLSAQNEHGDTPLHIASRQDNYECVVLFLARGADIETTNKESEMPLKCCPDPNSQTWMALSMNQELKRLTANRVCKSERILHKDISRGKELNPIQCVNGIDNELAPTDFLYITENCETSPIHVDRTITSLQSCRCDDDCTSPNCTCATISFKCWYDKEGHLLPEFNMLDPPMIFECNRACLCWRNCNNRVLQHGVTSRLQLFRTKRKGWGVRALKDIPKGSFICEYIGEIISDSEADQREDDSYLFDLDNRDGETYCLDARYYGNISRFINHLCEPNLVPVKIFVDHQDLSFPRIAFFSSRDINASEELGFDYGEKFWVIKYKWFTCGCGSPKCKYSKETIHNTLANYYRRLKEEQVDEMECNNQPV